MIRSNRDFYLHVAGLTERPSAQGSLERFLIALARMAVPSAAAATIDIDLFAQWIDGALGPPESLGPDLAPLPTNADPGYAEWHARISAQVNDLREMAADGTLADPMACFGIDAPGGARWFNLIPAQYLECASCGTFGGWEPGDDTGRDFVPGSCVAVDESGDVVTVDPQSVERRVEEIAPLRWEELAAFLDMGQCYE